MLNPADPAFLSALEGQLAPGTLRAPEPRDLEEPRGRWQGRAGAVALPRTVAEVAVIVRTCAAARVGIVPMGGGTGLVGGQIMADGPLPLILSLERMAGLRGIWPQENAMTVEAGMVLAVAHDHAAGVGRIFPLTLASEGSARIGGLLSTNAGGVNVLRYGNARDLVLGIEAVLPDGSIFNGLKRLRKDNTGYDLRHLLIGAEGTLGIITAASLRLFPAPASTATALLDVADPATALRLLDLANTHAAGLISAFELIHRQGLDFLSETLPNVAQPFRPQGDWMVLLELALPAGLGGAEAVMAGVLEAAFEAGLARDGAVAASDSQRKAIWTLRESIPLANRKVGAISSHDISLPLSAIPDFIPRANTLLAAMGDFRVNCFGHLGDGNLHYNVFPARGRTKADYLNQRETVKDTVHDLVHQMGGSVSAEHGIGRLKVGDLVRYGDPAKLAAMRAIKAALDPLGILNPGAVISAA
ncbi:FAD-binding oxidoreductase [Fuscibacter oryzae]|uniref:FAD-binding oxidoreductase n=1 Tax=Fuscibacter oryzae TaxID=2803939 RepID=A0A8J7MZY8_9RHOB|nr:FAD-binding oxidoreductase [Fuscibacter oryzae]MBL4929984.1 FAD-binding oxidoreductase [Fuscibacter oryzae]